MSKGWRDYTITVGWRVKEEVLLRNIPILKDFSKKYLGDDAPSLPDDVYSFRNHLIEEDVVLCEICERDVYIANSGADSIFKFIIGITFFPKMNGEVGYLGKEEIEEMNLFFGGGETYEALKGLVLSLSPEYDTPQAYIY